MREGGVKRDTVVYGIGVGTERIISFMMLPVLTKNLTPELYGIWSQIIVTIGLLTPVTLMGFQTAMVNFFSGGNSEPAGKNGIFHGMLLIVLANSTVVLVACAFLFPDLVGWLMFGNTGFKTFAQIFGLLLITEVIFELLAAYLRADRRIRRLSIYYIVKSTSRIGIIVTVIVIFHQNLLVALVWLTIAQFLMIFWIYWNDIYRKTGFSLDLSMRDGRWQQIIRFALPLIPYSFLIWINNFLDRYLILHILDITQVSIYAVAYTLAAAISIFYSILGFTLYPYLANHWNDERRQAVSAMMEKGFAYYIFFSIPFIALMVILNEPIIQLLTTRSFIADPALILFLALAIGMFGLYQINLYIILLGGKSLLNMKIVMAASLINLILNLLLIPSIGILGASIAMCLSNSFLAYWSFSAGREIHIYAFPWRILGRSLVLTGAVSVSLFAAIHFIAVSDLWTLGIVATTALSIYFLLDLLHKDSLLLKLRRAP
jgi:O-antigen/teichoic acid export membrane protein